MFQPPPHQKHEQQRKHVQQRRQAAPQQLNARVTGKRDNRAVALQAQIRRAPADLIQDVGGVARDKNRQIAVHKQAKAVIVRVQWRSLRIEVLTQVGRWADGRCDHRQKILVGVQRLAFTPVDA